MRSNQTHNKLSPKSAKVAPDLDRGAVAPSDSSASIDRGILYMVCGTLVVPIMDAIAKYLGDALSPLLITWGRFFFQFLIMSGILLFTATLRWPQLPFIHITRGLLLASATMCFFWSLRYLPLADAIAIFFIQPMILTLISALFLGEKIGWHRCLAVVIGFAGALLIIRPTSDSFSITSTLPLVAALFFASYLALTRAYSDRDSAVLMQFMSGLGALTALSVALGVASLWPDSALAPSMPTLEQWFWLACIGLIAGAGHLLVVLGMKRAPASLLAPFGYVEIIAATALGWFFFDDWPTALSWLGIAIVISSGIFVFARERQVSRAQKGALN